MKETVEFILFIQIDRELSSHRKIKGQLIEIQKLERLGTFNRRFRPKCRRAVKSQVEIQKLLMASRNKEAVL